MDEGEEGTDHPHRATLQENGARQGRETMEDGGSFLSCFGMGRPEQRSDWRREKIYTGEMTNIVERNENQEFFPS